MKSNCFKRNRTADKESIESAVDEIKSTSQKRNRTEDSKDTAVKIYEHNTIKKNSKRKKTSSNKNFNTGLPEGLSILANSVETRQKGDRLEYLTINMPRNLLNSFNTRDMDSLKLIIEEAFLSDCQLRTSAVPNEVTGRDKVCRFFETYIQGCPDVVMEYITPMQFNTRVISFICAEQGTRSNFNVPDELFDHLRHGVERTPYFLYERNKYSYFRNTGRPIPFATTSYVNFILNEEMTHVEKYIHTCKEVKVADPRL